VMLASLLADVGEAEQGIANKPVYYVLNLCRTVCYGRTGLIGSKREGGEWAVQALHAQWRPLVRQALDAYAGAAGHAVWDEGQLAAFAAAMLSEIRGGGIGW